MSDELDIKLKTILEADESKSAAQIEKQLPSIAGKIKGKIKVQVEADADSAKSIQASVKAATSSLKGGSVVVPIKIKADDQYLKRGLAQDFKRLKAQAGNLKLDTSAFESFFNTGDLQNAKKELNVLYKTLRAISAEGRASLHDLAITNFSKNVKDAAAQTKRLEAQFKSLTGGIPTEIQGKLSSLRTELEKLSQIPAGEVNEANVKSYKDLAIVLDDVKNSLVGLQAEQKSVKIDLGLEKLETDVERAKQKLENMLSNWSKAFTRRDFAEEWKRLFDTISSGSIKSRAELNAVNAQISLLSKQIEGAGLNMKTLGGRLWDNIKKFTTWLGAGNIIMTTLRSMREMVDSVKAIDNSMVSLKKVTDETDKTYRRFLQGASKDAVQLGTTITSLIDASSTFARLGFNLPDAAELGRVASLYYNVADGVSSIDDASQDIVSIMKAYRLEASDAIDIVDKLNRVGNEFSISSGGLGNALRRSAAALAEANNDINQSLALITAANNVIQDPDVVGNMWKTVSMRIRGAVTELEEAGLETEGMVESTAKLRDLVKALTGGFDIMEDAAGTTFKSTYDIILGISKVYDQMSDINQAALLEALAGKRQGNILAGTIASISDLEASYESAKNAAGSASREQERWMQSAEAKQKQSAAAFQAFSNAIMSSDLIKGYYDTKTGILGFLTTLTEQLGALPTLAAAAAAALSFKNIGSDMPLLAKKQGGVNPYMLGT